MTQRKETFRNLLNLLIIACVIILFGFLGGFVVGILDLGEAAGIILQSAFMILGISLGMKLISQYYKKPLTKEMEEEGIKEYEQKDERQLLFKPTTGIIVFVLFMMLIGIVLFFYGIDMISLRKPNEDIFGIFIGSLFMILLSLLFWYSMPVFTFADDSVHIKSHLIYLLGIDRKTVIRYADITSVSPNPKVESNAWGVEPRHSIVVSVNGTTQGYSLMGYDDDMIVKIYLRFKEKLGDKVKLE